MNGSAPIEWSDAMLTGVVAIHRFGAEEQLMKRHGCAAGAPDLAAVHLAQRRRFSEQVVDLRNAARRGETGSKAALPSFFEDWLVNPIMTVDKRLARFILGKD